MEHISYLYYSAFQLPRLPEVGNPRWELWCM